MKNNEKEEINSENDSNNENEIIEEEIVNKMKIVMAWHKWNDDIISKNDINEEKWWKY